IVGRDVLEPSEAGEVVRIGRDRKAIARERADRSVLGLVALLGGPRWWAADAPVQHVDLDRWKSRHGGRGALRGVVGGARELDHAVPRGAAGDVEQADLDGDVGPPRLE